ncbi:carbonic anhydrase [Dentipellis sp. KUC8613]|nr:carbonic anhydrase [Dentipellis sp. KUC8613]
MTASLDNLAAGNVQWADQIKTIAPGFFPQQASTSQTPKVLWIGCADSRVPESVITGSIPGAIFVHRNIANQFLEHDLNALAVLAHAVSLKVEHGHTHCGGVAESERIARPNAPRATERSSFECSESHLPRTADESPLRRWLEHLVELVKSLGLPDDMPSEEAIPLITKANVLNQVETILKTDIVQNAEAPPLVHGWIYDLDEGVLVKDTVDL